MSFITPDSELKLYSNVDITDEKHMIFQTAQEREAYFASHLFRANVEFSYMNPGDPIYIEIEPQYINQFNYISFKNKSFENKIFYARVKHQPDYENNEVRYIAYEIDAFTTYMFDVELEECEIVREHLGVSEKEAEDTNVYTWDIASEFTPEPLNYSDAVKARRNDAGYSYFPIMDFGNTEDDLLKPVITVITSQVIDGDDIKTADTSYDYGYNFCKASQESNFEIPAPTAEEQSIPLLKDFLDSYTLKGLTSSILGIYLLPHFFTSLTLTEDATYMRHQTFTFNTLDVRNGKLNRFPFRYIRVTDPLGNRKEYSIEKFEEANGGRNTQISVTFGIFYIMNGYPQVVMVPFKYDGQVYTGTEDEETKYRHKENYNFDEKMVFTEFPQVAYSTDGYLTWLGNALRGQALKDTTASPLAYNVGTELIGDVTGAIGGIGKSVVQGAESGGTAGALMQGGLAANAGVMNLANNFWNSKLKFDMHESGQNYMESNSANIEVADFLKNAEPIFASDQYHAGSGSVASMSAYAFNRIGFMVELVQPIRPMSEKYDKFLDRYGYNVFRIGKPRIGYYKGEGSVLEQATQAPIFVNNRTFVKTKNANVKGPNMMACQAIESMLNKGHWFEKVVSNG